MVSASSPPYDANRVLPDFCNTSAVFLLVLLGIVLALLLTLAAMPLPAGFMTVLGINALFIQWVILASAGMLCLLRSGLEKFGVRFALLSAFALIQAITLVFSALVVWQGGRFAALPLLLHDNPGLFMARNLGISVLASLLLVRHLALQQRWRGQLEAESRARLQALQARIRPHFLFNALNTITSLIPDRPDAAEQATLDLADLLRTGLREHDARITLGDELELVRGYLRLEGLRLDSRLDVDWRLAGDLPLEARLPPLILQPLVENAIVHGIACCPGGGRLRIAGRRRRAGRLTFEIENPLPPSGGASGSGAGMALDNIRQRLELVYDDGASLRTESLDGCFRVVLTLPLE